MRPYDEFMDGRFEQIPPASFTHREMTLEQLRMFKEQLLGTFTPEDIAAMDNYVADKKSPPPWGYKKLSKHVRCRCLNLWVDEQGDYWCCKSDGIPEGWRHTRDSDGFVDDGIVPIDKYGK